ncbi:hypothetical protein F3Y22_tig00110733pilonHSYRG00385 [Hibiscus syriacus]|uniref:Uncharacterized protein n=1 Tax=Hibiscus syriacus TaxID=106335 RepID=A0A6A2ZTB3_HIBSY|nr:hypothetical protein F3Y22_tig00110733pilonHSYRG00385 [Hibiscus syriacus]
MALLTTNRSDRFLTQCFISGLRTDIKNGVLTQRPTTMNEVLGRPPLLEDSLRHHGSIQPRRIFFVDSQIRWENGLCYYCDSKFVQGHKCKDPRLFLLDDEDRDEKYVGMEETDQHEEKEVENSDMGVQEKSLVSFTH